AFSALITEFDQIERMISGGTNRLYSVAEDPFCAAVDRVGPAFSPGTYFENPEPQQVSDFIRSLKGAISRITLLH
ncbi:MAG: hypothetical protein DCC75_12715, partial [Proteobacteria bacterium]